MSPVVLLPDGRRGKYNARPIVVDGQRFDSTGEANRWAELQLLARGGQVRDLRRQVHLALNAAGQADGPSIGMYIVDFYYLESTLRDGAIVWLPVAEDFKGLDTALSRWKRRHLALEYRIEVRVTRDARR
jgi:hypothetical protein